MSTLELQRSLRKLEQLEEQDAAWVTLSILHDSLKPDAISELLKLVPDHVLNKGEAVYESGPNRITAVGTHWNLRSDNHISGPSLEMHLDWMLEQLFGKLPAIRKLQNSGAKLRIKAHMEPWSDVVAPILDVNTIQRLAQLRIPLEIIIVYHNSEIEVD